MITQERLKELIHYDCNTGIFTSEVNNPTRYKGMILKGSSCKGYLIINIDGNDYRMHRLAFLYMLNRWPYDQVDHDNHIKDDNKWINLNDATSVENNKNQPIRPNNTSGKTGVYWNIGQMVWVARIKVNNKQIQLYRGESFDKACCARKFAEIKYNYHINHGSIKCL